MGVPSFYKWLVGKYPKIVVNAVEQTTEEVNAGGGILPNPNGREVDNLYLDMNGIIHPCFHPEYDDVLLSHLNSPVTYEEVFNNIFEYIDRILKIVRPRKLLYMAIDGVAPRAKMNQQRTRRFKNAKDRQILEKEEERLRRQYEIEGKTVLPNTESEVSDSNVITPGTEFMFELSKQLQSYIRLRITNNPLWKNLKVILSDASTPGEGEHKIMSFIRLQRTCPGYNPNTSHVLYGLDADLIMLALATHEVHFSILREDVLSQITTKTSNLDGTSEANLVKCRGWFKQFDLNQDTVEKMNNLEISSVSKHTSLVKKPYQFLHVWILREYLKLDLIPTTLPEKFESDIERLIDDFIFICFFAGNDFLPHMPTLEIHEGAIDLLIYVYKEEFKKLGGYLVDMQRVDDKKGGYIKLKRVEKFILAVGEYEVKIFQKRSAIRESKLRRFLRSDMEENEDLSTEISTYTQTGSAVGSDVHSPDHVQILENTKMLKEQLKSYTRETSDVFKSSLVSDMVKLGAPGWKKRYYKYKFSAETDEDIESTRKQVVEKYTEGLCWVLLYYFSGVPSWTWFFPYNYGPFASDLKGLSSTKIVFQRGMPFKPFDQLMAVLPPTSAHALPSPYRSLMSDEDSSILDFYPNDFDIDTDGKRFLWQGICKLPFIEEERLLDATKKIEKELSVEEAARNKEDADRLFVHSSVDFAMRIMSIYNDSDSINKQNCSIKIGTSLSGDVFGFVRLKSENNGESNGLANIVDVLCLYYDPPCSCLHIPRVLEGTEFPEPVVIESDIEERSLWHDSQAYHSRNNGSYVQVQGAATRSSTVSFRNPCPQNTTNGTRNYHWNHPRSYGQVQGATTRSSNIVGFRNQCPEIISKGGGTGWRGKVHELPVGSRNVSSHYGTRIGNEKSHYGQSTRTNYNQNGQFWQVRTDHSAGSSSNRWGISQLKNAADPREAGNGRW